MSAASPVAAERYVLGVDRVLALDAGAEEALRSAVDADDGFAVAHAALGFALHREGRAVEARAAATRARGCAARASRRERQHVEVVAAAIGGEARATALVWEHLADFPRDALALYQGMFLLSFGGGPAPKQEAFALYERVAPAYGEDWWFLGSFSFAHHEVGQLAQAWELAERSFQLNAGSASVVHSLAHLHYESGDHSGGLSFLRSWLPGYHRDAPYQAHLHWHRALHHLARDEPEDALAAYRAHISPAVSGAASVLADASSLLWRLSLDKAEEPLPWADVAALATQVVPEPGFPFADVHAAMASAGACRWDSLAALLDGLRALAGKGHPIAGPVVLPLVEGLIAFAEGNYQEAVDRLEPAVGLVDRIGGSRLQQEVFEDTLLVAYLRAGRADAATARLLHRLDRRASSRDARWLADARRLSSLAPPLPA